MQEDIRCCGTGTCLINAEGMCWCGQQWDGSAMRFAVPDAPVEPRMEPPADPHRDEGSAP